MKAFIGGCTRRVWFAALAVAGRARRRHVSWSDRSARPRPICGRCIVGHKRDFLPPKASKIDMVFVQSNADMIQQLVRRRGQCQQSAAGWSIRSARSTRARRSPSCASRCRRPPYALFAKPASRDEGPQGQGRFGRRGQGHHPHLLRAHAGPERRRSPSEVDMMYAGATSARAAALHRGAADAAILTPPYNFHAEAAGFTNLGLTVDYASTCRSRAGGRTTQLGAEPHRPRSERLLAVYTKSRSAWLYEPANKAEAVEIMVRSAAQARRRREDLRSSSSRAASSSRPAPSRDAKIGKRGRCPEAARRHAGQRQHERFALPEVARVSD